MKAIKYVGLGILLLFMFFQKSHAQQACPVPLYTDPAYMGAADPEIIWNEHEGEWWFYYTTRRSVGENTPLPSLAIGVAASDDWLTWEHKGYIKIDGVGGTPTGPNVLWAPGIVRDGDTYHMMVTFKKGDGRGGRWGIPESLLLHLVAPKDQLLHGWKTQGILHTSFSAIDATIIKHRGTWNVFHRDVISDKNGVNTYRITTDDLYSKHGKWNYQGPASGDVNDFSAHQLNYQEAQHVFFWKNTYWMLTDPSNKKEPGFALYRSDDLEDWVFTGHIMDNGPFEVQHPSVAVVDDRAFIFYFVQPYSEIEGYPEQLACYINVAELYEDGNGLYADLDQEVIPPNDLVPENGRWGFTGKP